MTRVTKVMLTLCFVIIAGCGDGDRNAAKNDPSTRSPSKTKPVTVRIIGRQFQWIFQYPGTDGRLGELGHNVDQKSSIVAESVGLDRTGVGKDDFFSHILILPVDTEISISTQSLDVRHVMHVEGINSEYEVAFKQVRTNGVKFVRPANILSPEDQMKHSVQFLHESDGREFGELRLKMSPYVISCVADCGKYASKQVSTLYLVEDTDFRRFLELAKDSRGFYQRGLISE